MEIIVASDLGMCSGLRTILTLTKREVARRNIALYGDFVHNPLVEQELERLGASRIDDLSQVRPGMPVLIGPHGNSPDTLLGIRQEGGEVINASCRRVRSVIDAGKELSGRGLPLVFVGQAHHEEARILRVTVPDLIIIEAGDDPGSKVQSGPVGVIAQSTETSARFLDVVQTLRRTIGDVVVPVNTVCAETDRRQIAAEALAKQVDLVLVIGGVSSYNTRALAETCSRYTRVTRVSSAVDVSADTLVNVSKVGITAGASTPDWVVDQVVEQLRAVQMLVGRGRLRGFLQRVRLVRLPIARFRSRLGAQIEDYRRLKGDSAGAE